MSNTILTPLTQAGQLAVVQTTDGSLVTGVYNGNGTGVTVGDKTYYPVG